jgi:hypothetical protein
MFSAGFATLFLIGKLADRRLRPPANLGSRRGRRQGVFGLAFRIGVREMINSLKKGILKPTLSRMPLRIWKELTAKERSS